MSRYKLIILLAMFIMKLPISNAETIYIHVEEDCLDRYEYILNGNKEGDVFVSYLANLGKNKSVILEVEKENRKWTKEQPRNLLSCNSFVLNKRLVQKINSGETKIFMVRSTDSHYNLTTVKKAIFYEQVAQTIELSSRDADFVFSLRNLVSGIDIAMPNSEMDVYLEGTVTSQCTKGYIIRRSKGFSNKSFKEWTLVPEIGIVEKRAYSASVGGNQKKNIFKLDKVNHLDYHDYLGELCTELQANIIDNKTTDTDRPGNYEEETYYSTELKDPRVNLNTSPSRGGNTGSNVQKVGPCGKVMKDGVHVVEKGQTLWSIARQYGVSVGQIQGWNSMKNNVINPCQELLVSNSTIASNTTTVTAKGPNSTETKEQPQKVLPTDKYKESGDFHRVKSGESLNTIALSYGYTLDRFRWMNGLGLNEDIYPGQILRTSDCVCPSNKDLTEKRPQPYDTPAAYDDTSRIKSGYAQNIADTTPKGTQIYVVRDSDTLYSIAKAFDTSVDNLMYLNNISKGEIILPSQRLYVK